MQALGDPNRATGIKRDTNELDNDVINWDELSEDRSRGGEVTHNKTYVTNENSKTKK